MPVGDRGGVGRTVRPGDTWVRTVRRRRHVNKVFGYAGPEYREESVNVNSVSRPFRAALLFSRAIFQFPTSSCLLLSTLPQFISKDVV